MSSADNERNLDDLIAAELGHDPAAEAFAGVDPALGFEDVSDEELAAERLDGDPEALAALLNTPLTNGIDDDVTVQEIDEPFAVTEIVDDEAATQKTVELDADGIDVVAISEDRQGAPVVEKFYRDHEIKNLEVIIDVGGKVLRDSKVRGLPMTLLINSDGLEVGRVQGASEWDSKNAVAFLRRCLKP